jgi:hypothetical protein
LSFPAIAAAGEEENPARSGDGMGELRRGRGRKKGEEEVRRNSQVKKI